MYRAAIEAGEILQVDTDPRTRWRDRLDNLYPLPGDGKTVWESATVAHPYRCHPVVMFTLHPTNALDCGTQEFERARRTMEPVPRLFGFRYEDRHAAIPGFEGGIAPNGFSSGKVKLVWPGGQRAPDCTAGAEHALVGDGALQPASVEPRTAPRRIAIETVENMVEPLVHYPENLPFAQVVEDDYLYQGRPAKFAGPRTMWYPA